MQSVKLMNDSSAPPGGPAKQQRDYRNRLFVGHCQDGLNFIAQNISSSIKKCFSE